MKGPYLPITKKPKIFFLSDSKTERCKFRKKESNNFLNILIFDILIGMSCIQYFTSKYESNFRFILEIHNHISINFGFSTFAWETLNLNKRRQCKKRI